MTRERLEQEMLAQPVRSLQYMLRRLAMEYKFLPEIVADGIFGEQTLEAVMIFQREFLPPVTGVVNWQTWNAIRNLWYETEQKLAQPRPVRVFPGEGSQVVPGSSKEFMVVPQAMFQVLSRYLNGIVYNVADGNHATESTANTRWLQRAAGLPETGIMNRESWDMLSRLYEVFISKDLNETGQGFTGGWG